MTLITILFCIAIQRLANIGGWFSVSVVEAYLKQLHPWLSKLNEWLGLLLIIVPVFALLGVLHLLFLWRLFGLFNLFLMIIVLFFAMDARDLKNQLTEYFANLEKNDLVGAANSVNDLLRDATLQDETELQRAVSKAIFTKSFTQMFSVLFWFIIFGAYGAAGYVLIAATRRVALKVDTNFAPLAKAAGTLQDILDWVPIRLLGFSYALVGHFNQGFSYCCKNIWLGLKNNRQFSIDSGIAALDVAEAANANEKENKSALDLVNRALIIWLLGVVLVSLGMWI